MDRIIIGGWELKWHATWTLPRGDKNQKTIFQLDSVHEGKFNLYLASGFVGFPSTVFLKLCFLLASSSPAYSIRTCGSTILAKLKKNECHMWRKAFLVLFVCRRSHNKEFICVCFVEAFLLGNSIRASSWLVSVYWINFVGRSPHKQQPCHLYIIQMPQKGFRVTSFN